jgi:carboxyl-terminal processing protease
VTPPAAHTPSPSDTPAPTVEPTAAIPATGDQALNQALIDQAWSIIQQNFVDRSAINGQLLTEGAIRGMVEALGDTGHTTFLTAAEAKADNSALSGSYEGIGAYVDSRNGQIVIVSPIDGGPAQKAGFKPGRHNGEAVNPDPLHQPAERIYPHPRQNHPGQRHLAAAARH